MSERSKIEGPKMGFCSFVAPCAGNSVHLSPDQTITNFEVSFVNLREIVTIARILPISVFGLKDHGLVVCNSQAILPPNDSSGNIVWNPRLEITLEFWKDLPFQIFLAKFFIHTKKVKESQKPHGNVRGTLRTPMKRKEKRVFTDNYCAVVRTCQLWSLLE